MCIYFVYPEQAPISHPTKEKKKRTSDYSSRNLEATASRCPNCYSYEWLLLKNVFVRLYYFWEGGSKSAIRNPTYYSIYMWVYKSHIIRLDYTYIRERKFAEKNPISERR